MTSRSPSAIKAFAPASIPKLVVGGPVLIVTFLITLFVAGGFMFSKFYVFDRFANIQGDLILDDEATPARAPHDAAIAQFYVRNGEQVQAGRLIARLDNSALDAHIAALRKKAEHTRAELAAIREEAQDALDRPRLSRIFSSVNTAAMAARIADIDKSIRSLLLLIEEAEAKAGQAMIYASVSGRVKMMHQITVGTPIKKSDTIFTIINASDTLRVNALFPDGENASYSPGVFARIIFTGHDNKRYGPYAARLRSTSKEFATLSALYTGSVLAEFELIAPRSQIAKQFEVQSRLRTQVLIKSGEQNFLELVIGAIL